jgi:hypothetical protein
MIAQLSPRPHIEYDRRAMTKRRRHIWGAILLLLTTLAALSFASCFSDYPCTEIGCAGDLVCNELTGSCEEFVNSCVQNGCADGLTCDEATGECRAPGARCVDDNCPAHQVCNAQTGYCEARTNCELDPCAGPAEQCDPTSGRCIPLNCDAEHPCPAAFYCSSGGVCRAGCRIGDEDGCADGEFCRGAVDQLIGQCREQCYDDRECPLGQVCRDSGGGSSCEPEAPCESDGDCRGEGVCFEHICRAPPCTSDQDCSGDQACYRPTGVCVGGGCEEDIHAPNQLVENAVELRPGRYAQLRICPLRSDWFALDLRSSDLVSLRLEHRAGADLDIFVYGPSGRLLASNQQTGPVTSLEMRSRTSQTVRVQISGTTTEPETYDLNVQRNPGQTYCRDDSLEENDRPAAASVLPTDPKTSVEVALKLCGDDADWFVLPALSADQGLEIGRSEPESEIAIDLFTPDGERFALEPKDSMSSPAFYIARLGAAGDYLLRVRSIYSNSASYRLGTRVLAPMECEDAGDFDEAADAAALPVNAVSRLAFCPLEDGWEVDWLALAKPQAAGELSARVVAVGDHPALDIALFEQTADALNLVRSAAVAEDSYNIRVPVEAGESYLLRLSSSAPLGRIVQGVDYQVFYRFESSAPPSD